MPQRYIPPVNEAAAASQQTCKTICFNSCILQPYNCIFEILGNINYRPDLTTNFYFELKYIYVESLTIAYLVIARDTDRVVI